MSVLDTIKEQTPPPAPPIPTDVKDKVRRAHNAMVKDAPLRRVCQKFFENEQYWYVNSRNMLQVQPTALFDPGKPDHRIRNMYNFIQSIVEGKVSAASQRVPGYSIDPSSSDWDDYQAARLAVQVAYYGYDKWRLRRVTNKAITTALVQREGFVRPYFDPNVGPFVRDEAGNHIGMGEIKHLTLTRSEVGWEPGVDFEDSRFYIIQRGMLKEDVYRMPGYIGGALQPDATNADLPSEKKTDEMVLVTEYLERPCPDYPEGRCMYMAYGRNIVDYRQDPDCPPDWDKWYGPYPMMTPDGQVADEPCIHRLSYTINPEGDDMGLVERIIDLQRTINDCWNKLLEWKNRALLPQLLAPKGSAVSRRDDTPGANWYYNPASGIAPTWVPTPPVPRELFDMLDRALEHLRALSADIDVQPDPDLAAKTANAAIETSRARWQSFLGDLAEFHSRLMRHDLTLVQLHYGEQRIIEIRGLYGSEPARTFTGKDLLSQTNVRVDPGSIEARSKQERMSEIQFIQQGWPGAISPEGALSVIHGGPAENLLKSYQLDMDRAWKVCMSLKRGEEGMLEWGERFDAELGMPVNNFMVPGWMPRKMDNIAVWKQVVADFMKTTEFDNLPMETQGVFDIVYGALEYAEQRRMMAMATTQQNMASQLGAQNAAREQPTPETATQKAITPQQAAPNAQTPEQ